MKSVYVNYLTDLFFYYVTATTEIYTLSLHDALPIYRPAGGRPDAGGEKPDARPRPARPAAGPRHRGALPARQRPPARSEEHTSELQSRRDLVCRLLLEKKKIIYTNVILWCTDSLMV